MTTQHFARRRRFISGHFRSRASAERFESQFLDLFQMRRCQEDLRLRREHPGCMYGEMGMCLRPCQQVVGPAEYARRDRRARSSFCARGGHSLLDSISRSRDRLSEEMQFEDAARQHKRLRESAGGAEAAGRIGLRYRAPARRGDRAIGCGGCRGACGWCAPATCSPRCASASKCARASRSRSTANCASDSARWSRARWPPQRQECLALLARWNYSTWRDGEFVGFESFSDVPYRKLVNAVSRVARQPVPGEA